MEVGLRVVRGPDWKWGNQDSGEGHVGTVVEIGKPSSSTSPDKTVVVQWDSGSRTNYRVGYHGQYDLRILDNAPTGVKHQNIICDFCKKTGIQGMRWKCTKCHDFDLCTECYMADKHDLGHAFQRFETASSKGVKMPKRKDISNSNKIQSFGIFPGAKVVRGPDWDWGNQDGGEGKVGKVTDIRGWDSESGRSVAHVTWTSGSTNVYRVGHKGKVDLKVNTPAPGIFYYREHLPVLGEFPDPVTAGGVQCAFKVGDKVRVDLEPDILKAMQEGHGGWNPRMADYIGSMGTVHRITDRGDVRVQYDGCSNRWTFHAGALTKVQVFNVDDIVIISDNIHLLREKQKGHGEWTDSMKPLLGQVGKVVKRYPDGDLRVEVRNQVWTLNPACCFSVQHKAPNMNNTNGAFERVDTTNKQLMEMKIQETGPDRLVREAAQGHTDIVRDIVSKFKDKVDLQSAGKTALQVAAHQGHKDIVQVLLNADCNLELRDEDGDTALHYSAFGNQAEVMEMLIMKGANINSVNNGGCSTLHVAVNKQHVECVSVLLRHKCNVNIQDSYGDTALHDAIGKESREIMEMLISVNDIDFSLKNKRGFNVLHHAALKGNNLATEKILAKCRQIVDVKKDDGFSAIHLAALNGHREVTQTLLSSGRADIEIRNNRQQTPLLLAVAQGHMPIIELLIEQGANVNVEDEDGDSCLHLSLMKTQSSEMERTPMMEAICADVGLSSESQDHVGLACYLAQQGADIYHKNHQGKTALDVITDDRIRESVRQYANDKMTSTEESEEVANCIVCDDQIACIQFFPCQHMVTCLECSIRAKKCLQCKTLITSKKDKNGEELNLESSKQEPSSTALRRKLAELEENVLCSICMERRRNMAFMCGHSACKTCGDELKNCHMCRKVITKRIVLYI